MYISHVEIMYNIYLIPVNEYNSEMRLLVYRHFSIATASLKISGFQRYPEDRYNFIQCNVCTTVNTNSKVQFSLI